MADAHPPELVGLLNATDQAAREAAWRSFINTYSRLLMHAARAVARDHDSTMDGYAHILEQLRCDDFRRLRGYSVDRRSKFTTWLVVVARRLCLDFHRRRYGRSDDPDPDANAARAARRRLVNLVTGETEPEQLAAPAPDPASALQMNELYRALEAATARLPAADRLLLKLRFDDDLPAREIAALLDLPTPFHVYRRLNGLLGSLRKVLRARGIQEAEP